MLPHINFYLLRDSVIFHPLAGDLQHLEAGSYNWCSIWENCGVRLACNRTGTVSSTVNAWYYFIWCDLRLWLSCHCSHNWLLQATLLEMGKVEVEAAWRKSSGIAPVRGRLEVSQRDHEAGGDSAGEKRGDGVEKEGESHRAEGFCASTQLRHPRWLTQQKFRPLMLTSKPVFLLLNLYPSS